MFTCNIKNGFIRLLHDNTNFFSMGVEDFLCQPEITGWQEDVKKRILEIIENAPEKVGQFLSSLMSPNEKDAMRNLYTFGAEGNPSTIHGQCRIDMLRLCERLLEENPICKTFGFEQKVYA